jgi:hypothetical protein
MVDIRKPSEPLDPATINRYHERSDVDNGDLAQHHTIGVAPGQAASGSKLAKLQKDFEELKAAYDAHIANDYSRIGKTVIYGGTAISALPNAPANPYTSISGFTNQWRDQPTGLQYQGLGIFNCTRGGRYLVESNFGLASSSVGRRIVFWYKNGLVDEVCRINDNASGSSIATVQAIKTFYLVQGDTIELRFFQDSGAALNMQQSGNLWDNGSDWSRMVSITTLG